MLKDKAKASRKSKATSRAKAMRRAKVMKVMMLRSRGSRGSRKARPRKIGWSAPTTWPRKSAAIIARTP